jgi:signal transduction histidine kinase/CheY-like chemotaxis protein
MTVDAPELRTLILAPIGRDGPTILQVLAKAGIDGHVCTTLPALVTEIKAGAGAVFVAEEALNGSDFAALQTLVNAQPPWSDLPFVVLSSDVRHVSVLNWREHILTSLRNVTLIERPVQSITLVSAVKSAVRARRRQYEVRGHMEMRQRGAAELERLVTERTQELEAANAALHRQMGERADIEERLRHSQKIEAIGRLTGGVAHDFNNLLMVITGGLNMLQRRPERRTEVIEAMQKAAARGARLTHQLLAFARRQELQPQPIDLKSYFEEISELLDRSLRGDVNVVTEIEADVWPVHADPGELQLVILNLAVNARDAMPSGGTVTITVGNARDVSTGDFVKITVSDTGTGMTPEVVQRVFEPFFTTKEVGKGSGLGLAQVHGFVAQTGGSVSIDSTPGVGTSVTLLLPRSEKSAAEALPKAADGTASEAPMTKGCVLLVEDEDEVAALVGEMLKELGYDVTRVASADAALGALANGRGIDVVFSDVMMPGSMNGLELSREIRRRQPMLPVLLTSGYADVIKRDAQAEGIALLPKPYQLADLAAAIERVSLQGVAARALH